MASSNEPERLSSETAPLLSGGGVGSDAADPTSKQVASGVDNNAVDEGQKKPSAVVFRVISILIIGAFTANADGSLVLATHPTIGSEFDALSASSWLVISFSLAGAATQTLYGKLSDVYGQRSLLIVAYAFFAAGCALVGVGQSMAQVVLGRVISGCGGAGMNVLAMLIISALVPIRDAASWQAGLNLAATTGRSLGGPLGGWLADTIGWRWSFLGQVPIFIIAIIFCAWYLPKHAGLPPLPTRSATPVPDEERIASTTKLRSSIARVDFLGALLLALSILAFLVPIQIGGTKVPWTHPSIFILFGAAVLLSGAFVATEKWWAVEPVFPLELLRHQDIVLSYIVSGAQMAAQLALMFAVPLYFEVTQRASSTVAGAHLFPAVAGNALGAMVCGYVIKRTGRYKGLLILGPVVSASSYLLLLLRWHGHTSWWESLYIIPGGFGTGIVQSAIFIAVHAATDPEHKGSALSGIWLSITVGVAVGLAAASAVTTEIVKSRLDILLVSMGIDETARSKIIKKAASSIGYIDEAEGSISTAIVSAYIDGLAASHLVSLICSAVAILASLFIRERKLS